MTKFINKSILILFIFFQVFFFHVSFVNSNIINKINIEGNNRISKQTIILFSDIQLNEKITDDKLNAIIKNLYKTNFFKNVSVKIISDELLITVDEAPIIDKVIYSGIKADRIIEDLNKIVDQKSRSSYNEYLINSDRSVILNYLKNSGYYFSKVQTIVEDVGDNLVTVEHKIDLSEKAKIKKISFIGNKIYKDSKLRNIIVSEEYKFWKFISGRKYLNQNSINLDQRLLKNFYLNNGYYNVKINSSFAKLFNEKEFELIFNINAKNKIYFNDISLILPNDFDPKNFEELNDIFDDYKGKAYSINKVEKILDKIDKITLIEEYKSINATVNEQFVDNKLNLVFSIKETENYLSKK